MPPLEERVEYPYQNIRVKNYPWGDGDKVSFLLAVMLKSTNELTFFLDHLVSFLCLVERYTINSHRPY